MDYCKSNQLNVPRFLAIAVFVWTVQSICLGQQIPRYEFNGFRGYLNRAYYTDSANGNRPHPAFSILDGEVIVWNRGFDHLNQRLDGIAEFEYCRKGVRLWANVVSYQGGEFRCKLNVTPLSLASGNRLTGFKTPFPGLSFGAGHFLLPNRFPIPSGVFVYLESRHLSQTELPWGYDLNLTESNLPVLSNYKNQELGIYRTMNFNSFNWTQIHTAPERAKQCVVIHGWNPKSHLNNNLGSSADPTVMGDLLAELTLRIGPGSEATYANFSGWSLADYNWSFDADTGPGPRNGGTAIPGVIGGGGPNDPGLKNTDSSRNGTEAAEIGVIHGFYLGEIIKVRNPNLKKLHLIAHSAGAWVARSAVWYLLEQQGLKIEEIEITLLDAYFPEENSLSPGAIDEQLGTSEFIQLKAKADSEGVDLMISNYYTKGWTFGTQESLPNALNAEVDVEGWDWVWNDHSVPIEWYRKTVEAPLTNPENGTGWSEVQEYESNRGFRDSLIWRDAWGERYSQELVSRLQETHWARNYMNYAREKNLTASAQADYNNNWRKIDAVITRWEAAAILYAASKYMASLKKSDGTPLKKGVTLEADHYLQFIADQDPTDDLKLYGPPSFQDVSAPSSVYGNSEVYLAIQKLGSYGVFSHSENNPKFNPHRPITVHEAILIAWNFFGLGGLQDGDSFRRAGILGEPIVIPNFRKSAGGGGEVQYPTESIFDLRDIVAGKAISNLREWDSYSTPWYDFADGELVTRAMFFKLIVNCVKLKEQKGVDYTIYR
jgi:hypothetical protein